MSVFTMTLPCCLVANRHMTCISLFSCSEIKHHHWLSVRTYMKYLAAIDHSNNSTLMLKAISKAVTLTVVVSISIVLT